MSNSRLLGDVPIGDRIKSDRLDFLSTAQVLAGAAVETEDPLTIGVFGRWGTGKTSLMKLIKQVVAEDYQEKGVGVWFNAWQYEKEEHLLIPLLAKINRELRRHTWEGELEIGSDKMIKVLVSIISGLSVKGDVGVPFLSKIGINVSLKEIITGIKEYDTDKIFTRSQYTDIYEELENITKKTKIPRIVVFVDDLDRCQPDKAIELIEHIKLVLNQQGFTFILGVYEDIISAVMRKKYEREYFIDKRFCEDYLDKIVQVQVNVPERKPKDLHEYIKMHLEKCEVISRNQREVSIPIIAEAGKRNPRSIIRLLNRITVTSRIGKAEGKDYDPLALLLHEATNESRYEDFRKYIKISVIEDTGTKDSGQTKQIGELIANELKDFNGLHKEWISKLRQIIVKSMKDEYKAVVDVLAENEYLFNLLKFDKGLEWLSNEEYREMLTEVSKSTERKTESEQKINKRFLSDSRYIIDQIEKNMVDIPDGTFQMGSKVYKDEQPIHPVTIQPFKMSAIPVTQAQYEAVMGHNPSEFKGADNPVENVSWNAAKEFCKKLSELTGREYRLPSEAQWEYACRAGSEGKYCFGDNEAELKDYAWYFYNSGGKTHPVGQLKPNAFGLYDMHGNVWEWCEDDWHDYKNARKDGAAYVENPRRSARVLRGGSWADNPGSCRSANRINYDPNASSVNFGFRVVFSY